MKNPKQSTSTSYPINNLASKRWSPRSFADKAVEQEKIYALFEAARWSPSAFNEQPWRFIVGIKSQKSVYEKIYEHLIPFNKAWAKFAPVLLVACTKKTYSHNGKQNPTAAYDLGQAVSALTHQATYEGLFVHQMGGFDQDNLRKAFGIDNDFDIYTVIAVGYLDSPEKLPDDLKKAETTARERNAFKEFIWSFD